MPNVNHYINVKDHTPVAAPAYGMSPAKKFAKVTKEIRDRIETEQDQQIKYANKTQRSTTSMNVLDKVWFTIHPISKAVSNKAAKFMLKRDGP